jgi:hypothetical protein
MITNIKNYIMKTTDQKNSSTSTSGPKSMDKKTDKKETSPKRETKPTEKDAKKPAASKKL